MKKRAKGVSDGAVPPEGDVSQSEDASDSASCTQSPLKEQEVEPEVTEGKQTFCVYCRSVTSYCVWDSCENHFYLGVIFLTRAFYSVDRRGQQWSNQTYGGSAEESEEAGKPAAEVQRRDAYTQGAERPAGQWEWNSAGAAAGETAGAGEDEGGQPVFHSNDTRVSAMIIL